MFPWNPQETPFFNAIQVQCKESTDHYAFLSPNSGGTSTGQLGETNPGGSIGDPTPIYYYAKLNLSATADPSGLVEIAYNWGASSLLTAEWNLIAYGQIFHVPSLDTPLPYGQPVCTVSSSSQEISGSCEHQLETTQLGVPNYYKSITYYIDDTSPKIGWVTITPEGPSDPGGSGGPGESGNSGVSNNGLKDAITLYVFEETNIRLAWDIVDFAKRDQIASITVGKLEGTSGFQLSEQLSVSVTETVDRFWKRDVSTQYLLNVTYKDQQEKLYTCENITF